MRVRMRLASQTAQKSTWNIGFLVLPVSFSFCQSFLQEMLFFIQYYRTGELFPIEVQ